MYNSVNLLSPQNNSTQPLMSKPGPNWAQLVLQGLRCEWGAGLFNLVLSLSLSHTGHWKFNMAPHGKKLSENLKTIIVALHKDGIGYKKIAKTLKLQHVG